MLRTPFSVDSEARPKSVLLQIVGISMLSFGKRSVWAMIYPQTVGTALTGHTPGSTSVRQHYPLTFRHCFLSFQEGRGDSQSRRFLGGHSTWACGCPCSWVPRLVCKFQTVKHILRQQAGEGTSSMHSDRDAFFGHEL